MKKVHLLAAVPPHIALVEKIWSPAILFKTKPADMLFFIDVSYQQAFTGSFFLSLFFSLLMFSYHWKFHHIG